MALSTKCYVIERARACQRERASKTKNKTCKENQEKRTKRIKSILVVTESEVEDYSISETISNYL